jgi:uncharacterized protein (UPF0297 family)
LEYNYEKAYAKKKDPIFQIMGYLITEDPSYITGHDNARAVIRKYDRDDLMEAILTTYFA